MENGTAVKSGTIIHVCMDIRGYMRNTPKHRMAGLCTREDGSRASADEVMDFLLDHIAQGHKVIPLGECDNFDWQTGCRGHPAGGDD